MRDIDRNIFKYADTQAVVNAQSWTGDTFPLFGVQAINVQIVSSNGATGTLYVDGTNQDSNSGSYVTAANNVAVSAGGTSQLSFTLTDSITSMRAIRLRFVPTASGNIRIDINLRRIYP